MKVKTIRIQNLRSIEDSGLLSLGPITLLVGKNNSGKSAFLRGIHAMQSTGELAQGDRRYGTAKIEIDTELIDVDREYWADHFTLSEGENEAVLKYSYDGRQHFITVMRGVEVNGAGLIRNTEPNHFIYPYLASRKVMRFEEAINEQASRDVRINLSNLGAKVDKLMDGNHPYHDDFDKLVKNIIGLPLSAIASGNGKKVGMWINESEWIPLENMGDGIAQMLGLITQICLAKGKLFIIEELENDIHPEGLKLLLNMIEDRSIDNQFIISTHSNIVLRHLGALPNTLIYEVRSTIEARIPLTTIKDVGKTVEDRSRLLHSLGYELSDLDLFDGWIIFEESSAERIVRDHLIRWFAPGLSRVRPVASNGTSDIERSFEALNKLTLFTYLQERYNGRVLVIADGDPSGIEAINKLKERYRNWEESSFIALSQTDFEKYYPERFSQSAQAALSQTNKRLKKEAKENLLKDVLKWIEDNEEDARSAFESSAGEVVELLRGLERALEPASETITS